MTEEPANAVYDVLVAHAGASEDGREDFVFHESRDDAPDEYRFGGGLGFGGKFRRVATWTGSDRIRSERWYVDCYREDLTPERAAAIEATNAALAALRNEVKA